MALKSFRIVLLSLVMVASFSPRIAAQSADKVKSDVLSAMSTPLPMTIIGPLLTREVVVTEEGDGFRATLGDTSLMGLFSFGDVSLHLTPIDDENYHVTDLQFSKALDFPGIGKLTFTGMELDGIWSAKSRSYSALKWLTNDLNFQPDLRGAQGGAQGPASSVTIGSLLFDVIKEADTANTESRFEITAGNLSVLGMGPQDVTLGEVKALLAANGDKPVDLYSVIRELLMLGTVRDGGAQLQALGQSLLGNTYDSVTMDLSARDLSATSTRSDDDSYFKAGTLHVTAALSDVEPRDWGGAEVTLRFGDVDQLQFVPDSALRLDEAVLRVSGGALPVADMMAAVMTLAEPPHQRPVDATMLLDGLLGFGKLEIATEGKAIWLEGFGQRYDNGDYKKVTEFETSFDKWGVNVAVEGLNRNEGTLTFGTDFAGGEFIPGDRAPDGIAPHIEAWFPKELKLQSSLSNLNEGLLKQMFKDVQILDMYEPVEVVMPLLVYAASTVMDVVAGENIYETALFRIEQNGAYQFFPTEVLKMAPYEGEMNVRMTGLTNLLGYFDETFQQVRMGSSEATGLAAVKSGLIVLRNLAEEGEAGALQWNLKRPDVTRNEFELNGIVLRYPDVMTYLPMMVGMAGAFR